MAESVAWFVDGAYVQKVWYSVAGGAKFDYKKFRNLIEQRYCSASEVLDEAYYFSADPDPPTAARNAFHNFLAYPPPTGPGLRVKLYWLSKKTLNWPAAMGGGAVVHPRTGQPYELILQKGVDVGLAFHLMRSFQRKKWKKLVLAAGDGDFHEVVQYLVETENVDVYGVGTQDTMSAELRPYLKGIVSLDSEIAALQQ